MQKKLQLLVGLIFVFITAQAQDEYTIKFFDQINQSSQFNASNRTDAKVSIGLPVLSSTSFYFFNNGFTYNDLFNRNAADSSLLITPGNIMDKLKAKNHIGFGTSISLGSFNYANRKWSAGFSVADKMMFKFTYPGDLLKLAWYGNAPYVGSELEIGNFAVNFSYYREYATHFTYTYKKWQFGLSPKLLFGKANINTAESSIKLLTDANTFKLSADANVNIQTSGFPDSTERKNSAVPTAKNYIFNTANKGFALDVAAAYQYNEKLKFSVGVNDWGSIAWKSRINNYTMHNAHIDFDGVNLADLADSSSNINSSKFVDSIKNIFKLETNHQTYKTSLPINFFAMANYDINKHHSVAAQLSSNTFHQSSILALTLCYQLKLSKHFTGTLTYTNKSYAPINLGGGIMLRFLGMQTYFITDNWLAAVKPLASKNVNFRFGMNIVIGNAKELKDKTPKPLMVDEKKEPTPTPAPTEPTPPTEPKK
ncbi:MAG: hypothetical protein RIQ33_1055 [Bacteroidota bacterium]|jgi:hypothetical protein